MNTPAPILAPATRTYSGDITRPERWATWVPNKGDILVCTPSKCGTTWTQTILAMLIHGGVDLPAKLPVLSPWVDADLGVSATDVAAALAAQTGRRVVKTHTSRRLPDLGRRDGHFRISPSARRLLFPAQARCKQDKPRRPKPNEPARCASDPFLCH